MPNIFFPYRNKPIPDPSPEMQFLIECLSANLHGASPSNLDVLNDIKIDWTKLRELAFRHRVLPLLYKALIENSGAEFPADAQAAISKDYRANTARNIYLAQELLGTLELFESSDLDAIPIKGPLLADKVYGDIALRQIDDLDTLIRVEDLGKVSEVLVLHGFRPSLAQVDKNALRVIRGDGECAFISPQGDYRLDVHWRIDPRGFYSKIDHQVIWEESNRSLFLEKNIRVLADMDHLVLLCLQNLHHQWSRLIWTYDIVNLVQIISTGDWDRFIESCSQRAIERPVALSILFAAGLANLEVNPGLESWIKKDQFVHRESVRIQVLFEHDIPTNRSILMNALFTTKMRPHYVDKIAVLAKKVFIPGLEDWNLIRLPFALRYLYGVLRPIRLIFTYLIQPIFKNRTSGTTFSHKQRRIKINNLTRGQP